MFRKVQTNVFLTRILPALFVFMVIAGTSIKSGNDDIYTKINRDMDIFGRVYKEIVLNYVDEVDPDRFIKAGIEGMLSTLDPYTNFLDASRKDEVDLLTTGKYGGVGISIGVRDSLIVITNIMEGYSAQREGLKTGDKILAIDGIDLYARRVEDVRTMVRGAPGTQLSMKVGRGDREFDVVLTRQEIKLKNVSYYSYLDGGIGYVKLERFSRGTENELVDAINDIKSKGKLNGFILDLRDNPGGLLDAAIAVLNKFTEKGSLLLITKGRADEQERKFFSEESPLIGSDVPMAVMINENSASASEIVAGAIQDLDRGIIIGSRSYGKGLVQIVTPLNYDTQLRITTQKYFTPSGRWIQAKNYFKENKAGIFKPNPYYSQIQFKTLNGRTVFAEGGIDPDSAVKSFAYNEMLEHMMAQDLYYKFIEKYFYEHTGLTDAVITDSMLDDFYSFVMQSGFSYTSSAEKKLNEIKTIAENKNYSAGVSSGIVQLEESLKQEKLDDFNESRNEIKRLLEIELLRKLNKSEKDIFFAGFNDDSQLQAAIRILSNPGIYNGTLSKF